MSATETVDLYLQVVAICVICIMCMREIQRAPLVFWVTNPPFGFMLFELEAPN